MLDLIIRLRARPLAYRRRVAFWSTVAITVVIALVWALSLSVRFGDVSGDQKAAQAPSPFETFVNQIGAGVASLKDRADKNGF